MDRPIYHSPLKYQVLLAAGLETNEPQPHISRVTLLPPDQTHHVKSTKSKLFYVDVCLKDPLCQSSLIS